MKTIEERAKEYVSKKHIDCGNCDTCVKCPDYWTYISIAKEQKKADIERAILWLQLRSEYRFSNSLLDSFRTFMEE